MRKIGFCYLSWCNICIIISVYFKIHHLFFWRFDISVLMFFRIFFLLCDNLLSMHRLTDGRESIIYLKKIIDRSIEDAWIFALTLFSSKNVLIFEEFLKSCFASLIIKLKLEIRSEMSGYLTGGKIGSESSWNFLHFLHRSLGMFHFVTDCVK